MFYEDETSARAGTPPAPASAGASEGLLSPHISPGCPVSDFLSSNNLFHYFDHFPITPVPALALPASILIAEGGRFVELASNEYKPGQRVRGGKEAQSRAFLRLPDRRLICLMACINYEEAGLPDFITTTYPAQWSRDWRDWKRDEDAFIKALVRKWPEAWGIWRMEFQPNRADHAVHFHYLAWDGPGVEGMRRYDLKSRAVLWMPKRLSQKNEEIFKWLSETWYRIVGSGDERHLRAGTQIKPIESPRMVASYISKYLAKLPDGEYCPVNYTGRFWGVFGRHRWKINMHEGTIPKAVFYKIRRVLEKIRQRHGGRIRKGWNRLDQSAGIKGFISNENAIRLVQWAIEEAASETQKERLSC